MEDDVAVGRQGQPGVGSNLCLKLAFAPSSIPQGNRAPRRLTAVSECLDDTPRGRQVDARRNLEGGLPLLLAGVQHKAALNLYRPSGEDCLIADAGLISQLHLHENIANK